MGDPWNDAIALHAEAANRGDKVAAKTATHLANAIAERDAEIRRLTARVQAAEAERDLVLAVIEWINSEPKASVAGELTPNLTGAYQAWLDRMPDHDAARAALGEEG